MEDKTMFEVTSKPKVSIIVPTQHRINLLPEIIDCFNQQTWRNKELLILDDTPNGKEAIEELQKKYPNIHLWHSNEIRSIGNKRNKLIQKASGELIAHFDDDDYYAPTYIEALTKELINSNADLLKLSAWFCVHEASKTFGYWDTTRTDLPHTVFTGSEKPAANSTTFSSRQYESYLTGYGFSYIFKKSTWSSVKFDDISFGEDSRFYEKIASQKACIKHLKDTQGICLHVIHSTNTSRCFPNYLVPTWLTPENLITAMQMGDCNYDVNQHKQSTNFNKSNIKQLKQQNTQNQKHPFVSVCTITYNRTEYFPLLLKCIESQDYPLDRIEWVILDDSDAYTEELNITSGTSLRIKYKKLEKHVPLGTKRNLSHELCSGEYIVYMDDDDYYPPERISHAVDTLMKSEEDIAGSTKLLIYFTHDDQIWLSGPFHSKHATANSFAMTKNFASQHFYDKEAMCNEEKSFLNNYTIPMAQLDPTKTTICLAHNTNTFDKRRMRANGPSKNMRPLTTEVSKPLLLRLGQAGYRVNIAPTIIPQAEPSTLFKEKAEKPTIALVCGPWGSGTSALCKLINTLGVHAKGPFYRTGDQRTPDSFEMSTFNALVRELVDETTLQRKESVSTVREKLITFSNRFLYSDKDCNSAIQLLKTPACSALLHELDNVFSLRVLICLRDLESIEQSRLRRGWPEHLGKSGAIKIYDQIHDFAKDNKSIINYVHYKDMIIPEHCELLIPTLCDFLGLSPSTFQIKSAIKAVSHSR